MSAHDAFLDHLVRLLAVYEQGSNHSVDFPFFSVQEENIDGRMNMILVSLSNVAKRMWIAEEALQNEKRDQNKMDSDDMDMDVTRARIDETQSNEMSFSEELELTKSQILDVVRVCNAVERGDVSQRVTESAGVPEMGQLKDAVNGMIDNLEQLKDETIRISQEVQAGVLGGNTFVLGAEGVWADLTDSVNNIVSTFTDTVRIASANIKAISGGDFTRRPIIIDGEGEISDLGENINTLFEIVRTATAESTRVVKQVGTEGKLGQQAQVENASGAWKELLDNVNNMSRNLTIQVRTIDLAIDCVVRGDLMEKIVDESALGEMARLFNTINNMIDKLSAFSSELKEVIEGTTGAQIGTGNVWKDWGKLLNHL